MTSDCGQGNAILTALELTSNPNQITMEKVMDVFQWNCAYFEGVGVNSKLIFFFLGVNGIYIYI